MKLESTIEHDRYLALPAFGQNFDSIKRTCIQHFPKFLLASYALVSMVIPLVALVLYRANLESKGIFLESGCHGPEPFFGSLSGMIFCLLIRFGFLPFFSVDENKRTSNP